MDAAWAGHGMCELALRHKAFCELLCSLLRMNAVRQFRLLYPATRHMFIYLFVTAIGLTPGGSSTVHIYTQTVHRIQRTEHT
jgi:hypothetical protein